MLLAADIGNTQSHMGLFEGDELVQHWRFATRVDATADELAVGVSTLLALRGLEAGTVDGTIVSSVVPQLTPEYQGMNERYLRGECMVLGPGVKTGMPIQLDNPHEPRADRSRTPSLHSTFSAAPAPSRTSALRSRSTWSRRAVSIWAG